MFFETFFFVSVPVKQNLFVSLFVHKCLMMLNDVNIQNVCHANEQLSLYFFSINWSAGLGGPPTKAMLI